MNSVLQCVSNTPPLTELCLTGALIRDGICPRSSTKGRMARAWMDLVQHMWREGAQGGAERPSAVKAVVGRVASRFLGYDQQDAQEFLRFFLDSLHSDVTRIHSKPPYEELDDRPDASDARIADEWWDYDRRRNDSPVRDLFCGQLRSEVCCQHCGHVSRAFDSFWDLSLPIPRRKQAASRRGLFGLGGGDSSAGVCQLRDCLEGFTAKEDLGKNGYQCSKCKAPHCVKRILLWRLPRVLVVHLKRFSFSTFRRSKVTTAVETELTGVDFADFCHPESPAAASPGPYSLVAVSNHSGSINGGHYTADCRNADDGRWYTFNDSRVGPSRGVSGSAAYLLFFVRG